MYDYTILWVFSLGVIGDSLDPDSKATMRRVNDIRRSRKFDTILFTGGVFDARKGQTIPVARLMYNDLDRPIGKDEALLFGTQCNTTRSDIADGLRTLAEARITLKNAHVTAVSEKWHLRGIHYLLWRKVFRKYKGSCFLSEPSDLKVSTRGLAGRIARLFYYLWDPEEKGWLTRREAKKRSAPAETP